MQNKKHLEEEIFQWQELHLLQHWAVPPIFKTDDWRDLEDNSVV